MAGTAGHRRHPDECTRGQHRSVAHRHATHNPAFEFRHLHAMARVRIGAGTVLVGLGVITLVGGSFTAVAFAWAAFFLVLAALQFSVGYWYLAIIRSASA